MLKTVFFGTPSVAVPFLELLNELTQVVLVVTQPDRPCGRGLKLKPCPVREKALELGLKVISPEKLKDNVEAIKAENADLGIVVAYGKIFRKPALESTRMGLLNIHFSKLPAYRGAAPVQYALFNGEEETGVSAFWINEGLDDGPLAALLPCPILPQDDAKTLFPKLIDLGKTALRKVISDIEEGKIIKNEQKGEVTFAPSISKEQTLLSFKEMSARQIHNTVRGLAAAMPAYAKANTKEGQSMQLIETELSDIKSDMQPGQIVMIERNKGFFVQCKEGVLFIKTLRPAGKNIMTAGAYLNGRKIAAGDFFFE